jgi:hypothetical protein
MRPRGLHRKNISATEARVSVVNVLRIPNYPRDMAPCVPIVLPLTACSLEIGCNSMRFWRP